ncbi:hypothetical protein BDN72DRAFT_779865 [Pluteus cervinus]|uniref:Uncharacterized protein n=1 Tax=Pluteus cervinus TaxID=181527 RepID=A0ACD3A5F5_9AGAR|nr:hypothetical protein BDN72DRAFT_779865 [Pluteus cervinus]
MQEANKPKHHLKLDKKRSNADPNSAAFHFGTWEVTSAEPHLTNETKNQSPNSISAIDELLGVIGDHIAPKVSAHLKRLAPVQYGMQQTAYSRVRRLLEKEYKARPSLDFGGSFFTVAVKEGSSEVFHIDWNDAPQSITWLLPVGEGWVGGELCLPQLGYKIPTYPGQILGVLTRHLVHATTPVTSGRRIIFTCFTDSLVIKHSQ